MRKLKLGLFAMLLMTIALGFAISAKAQDFTSGISISLVNQDPQPAVSGDILTVSVGVANLGSSSISSLQVGVENGYPFTVLAGDNPVKTIPLLSGFQGSEGQNLYVLTFRVRVDPNAQEGTYPLKISYASLGSSATAEATINIEVKGSESANIIRIDKTVLNPGTQSNMRFEVTNVGNSPLRQLSFSWSNPDKIILPVGSDNTRYVNYLDVGKSTELDYQVIADTNAQPGLYQLDLLLNYQNTLNSTVPSKISTTAGIYVGGGTNFEVAFTDSSSGTTSFTVANTGSNPATSVAVILPAQPGWLISGPNSVIIGNLNKGDYTVASFKLQSAGSTNRTLSAGGRSGNFNPGEAAVQNRSFQYDSNTNGSARNSIQLQIAYTDTMGNRQTIAKDVAFSFQQLSSTGATGTIGTSARGAQQNQSFLAQYWIYLVIFAASVLGIYAYMRFRKKKTR
jgi:hypothetical protein